MRSLVVVVLAVALAALSAAAFPASSGSGKKSRVTVRAVYTMVGCSHCHELERSLRRSGVRLAKSATDEYRYDSYPTVVYSDGRRDSGQRIYRKGVRLPSRLRVVEAQ